MFVFFHIKNLQFLIFVFFFKQKSKIRLRHAHRNGLGSLHPKFQPIWFTQSWDIVGPVFSNYQLQNGRVDTSTMRHFLSALFSMIFVFFLNKNRKSGFVMHTGYILRVFTQNFSQFGSPSVEISRDPQINSVFWEKRFACFGVALCASQFFNLKCS